MRGVAFAFGVGGGKFAFDFRPFAAKRLHQDGFNQRFDISLAGVMRAKLRALLRFQGAFKQRAHDAGFNKLPVGFARIGKLAQFGFGEFKDAGFFKQMPVEITNLVFAKRAAFGHDREKFFQRLGKQFRVINSGFGNLGEKSFRQKAGVLGKETKDNAIQKAGDAQIFLLRDVHFRTVFGVGKFDAFAALKRFGNFGDLHREIFGDLRRGALRFEKRGIGEQGAE